MESLDDQIKAFLSIGSGDGSGSGSGSGYGDGDGSGSGYGSGYGYGSGSGYGDGYGSGYGYGSGSGSGDGDGSGSGSGYGFGSGSGYGDGDGIKTFNGEAVYMVDDTLTIIRQVKGNYAKGAILKDDLTLEDCFIAKVDSCFAHGKTLHEAFADAQAKALGDLPEDERIDRFCEAFKSLDEKHTGREFYDWHHILTGSCTMGRDEFCKAHDVRMDEEYTVGYFLQITEDSYGSSVIKEVMNRYKND